MKGCREGVSFILLAVLGRGAMAPEIGVAMAQGNVRINHKVIPGTATLFHGSLVETAASLSTLLLPNSSRIDLASGTVGVVYRNRLVLKDGTARANLRPGYFLESESMVFKPSMEGTETLLRHTRSGVDLTVNQGQVSVHSQAGVLLARINGGDSVHFDQPVPAADPQAQDASKPAKVQLTGKLEKTNDHYILTDKATNITQELVGKIPAEAVGKVVTVVGEVKPNQVPWKPGERVVLVERARTSGGGFPCFSGGGSDDGDKVILIGPLRAVEGHYLLTDDKTKVTSELIGKVPEALVGQTVSVKGLYRQQGVPFRGADQLVALEGIHNGAGGFMSTCQKAWIAGSIITATGIGLGIGLTRDNPAAISR